MKKCSYGMKKGKDGMGMHPKKHEKDVVIVAGFKKETPKSKKVK
jgi:hypothetical protein